MLGTCLFVETLFCIECFCMKHAYIQYVHTCMQLVHSTVLLLAMVLLKDIHYLHLCTYLCTYVIVFA